MRAVRAVRDRDAPDRYSRIRKGGGGFSPFFLFFLRTPLFGDFPQTRAPFGRNRAPARTRAEFYRPDVKATPGAAAAVAATTEGRDGGKKKQGHGIARTVRWQLRKRWRADPAARKAGTRERPVVRGPSRPNARRFASWAETWESVRGFKGSVYRRFDDYEEAWRFSIAGPGAALVGTFSGDRASRWTTRSRDGRFNDGVVPPTANTAPQGQDEVRRRP